MKGIKYSILYCVSENFCDTIYYGSGSATAKSYGSSGSASATLIVFFYNASKLGAWASWSGSSSQRTAAPLRPPPGSLAMSPSM
jgi:hypothetical protein